jgi:hypothetical protein
MSTNTNEQVYKDLILSYNDLNGDKSISFSANAISFTKDKLSSPVTTFLNQNGIQLGANSSSWQNLSLLDDVLASCEMPPNPTTLKLNNSILLDNGSSDISTLSNDTFSMFTSSNGTTTINQNIINLDNSSNNGPTNTLTPGDVTINDYGSSMVSNLTSDYIMLRDGGYTIVNQITNNNINMIDNNTNIEVEINTNGNISSEPFVRLQNTNGISNYYNQNSISANSNNCFVFNNNEKFFKQNNPFSYTIYYLNDGDYIEKHYPFIFCQNINVIKLFGPSNYLDDNNNAGWSCLVSNYSTSDIQIDTAGLDWFSHFNGYSSNPIYIKKWVTCRLTLIFSQIDNNYIWARCKSILIYKNI